MSRRHRPLGEYLRAAERLAHLRPQFLKYVGREDLEPHEKAAIANAAYKTLSPISKQPILAKPLPRTDAEYVQIAARLSRLAPGLSKYKRRKKLNNGEKSAISHKEKILRYSDHLVPVTKRQAKNLKGLLFAPGVRAIQLRNTAPDAKIVRLKKDMVVTSNGRTFIYWRLDNVKVSGMKKAAKAVFTDFSATFQIEQLAELAKRAFAKLKPVRIYLWAEAGRVGEGFRVFDEFMQWLYEDYSQYKAVERWVNGIAIQIA